MLQTERIDNGEITSGTLRNYLKALKLFCKMNRIGIFWDIISHSVIIIDEIDKMQMQHQEGLLTMMERGEFTSTKVRNTQTVKLHSIALIDRMKLIARYKAEKLGDATKDMKIVPVNFNSEHKAMLGHCKMILENDGGRIAINPDKFDKLITALRTAIDNDGTLDKKYTSYNDILMHLD